MTNNQWKQYSLRQEIPTNLSFIWKLIKNWAKRKPYHLTISFAYKESKDSVSIANAQIEFK